MKKIDEIYTKHPSYGVRRITVELKKTGYKINRKRVRRLMRLMGLEALYPKPKLSVTGSESNKYPYLLRGVKIERKNQVWSTDITYIRIQKGFIYLVAISNNGLVQQICIGLGGIKYVGHELLHINARKSITNRKARNIQ